MPDTKDDLKMGILGSLRRMRDYRRQFDAKRSTFYRQYIGQRDAQKFPDNVTNRSNTFVPYPLSNVETVVSRVDDAFFSFQPWFETDGSTSKDDVGAEAMQMVLFKKLEEAKFKAEFEELVRNIAIYGHAGIKVDWNWDFKTITKPAPEYVMVKGPDGQPTPYIDPTTGQPLVRRIVPQTTQVPMACPRIRAIDIYDMLCDPDGGIIAHLTEKPLAVMIRENMGRQMAQLPPLYDPAALQTIATTIQNSTAFTGDAGTVLIRFAEVWNSIDGTYTLITFGDDSEAIGWKDLRASYRATNYSSYKRPIYTGQDVILMHDQNPFAHKRNPILCTSYIKLPNELYGLGAIETTTDLTESLNKMVNMIADNWNLGINRRYAYDENADIDHEALNQFNVPGGKVPVGGDPNKVIAPLPLFTPAAGDYQILDLYRGMIEMTSGISDFYGKGVGSSGGNRTATGINTVTAESNYRFKLFIRNLEIDILTPLLEMCASMCQQYLTDQQEVQITKNQAPGFPKWTFIDPADLIGNFDFTLVAANYSTNKEVRQRNFMSFMQIAQQTPYWNQGEGIREAGKLLEIRNVDNLIKPDQQVQQEQAEAQQHQMQMALVSKLVDIEGQIDVAEAKGQSTQVASNGQAKAKEGRPTSSPQVNPGQSAIGIMKSIGQLMGDNATGNAGAGEVPNAHS
jgi:hypothetical protein